MEKHNLTRAQTAEEAENAGVNDSSNPTMGEIVAARYNRRELLRGALAVTAISASLAPFAPAAGSARAQEAGAAPSFNFREVPAGADERHHVAEGYDADLLIRWGDPVLPGAPAFDPMSQTAEAQKKQFGYNNDFLGYFLRATPIRTSAASSSSITSTRARSSCSRASAVRTRSRSRSGE